MLGASLAKQTVPTGGSYGAESLYMETTIFDMSFGAQAARMVAQVSRPLEDAFSSEPFLTLRLVFIALSLVLVLFMGWLVAKTWPMRFRMHVASGMRTYRSYSGQKVVNLQEEQKRVMRVHWGAIIEKIEQQGEPYYPLAIIEADRLVDHTLERLGYFGQTFGERLRGFRPEDLPGLNALWDAHKLRNKIAHEPNIELSETDTLQALRAYKKALEELGVL